MTDLLTAESRPCLKGSAMAVGLPGDGLLFPFLPRPEAQLLAVAPWQKAFFQLLDGERTLKEIAALLPLFGHEVSLAEVLAFVRDLDSRLLLEEGRDGAKEDRYSRQRLFFGAWRRRGRSFAQEAQKRLASSRVVLFGVGGGGCHVLQSLASFGLGGITVVDGDVVTPSNLNRQCLYRPDDVGRSKIDVLRRELPRINGDVAFSFVDRVMRGAEDFASLIADADLAILTADSPRQSIFGWFDDALFRVFRPGLFTAGVSLGGLSLGPLVVPGETACYRCSLPPWTPDFDRPEVKVLNGAYRHGVIAPHLAVLGGLMALETVRFLTGFEEPLTRGARLGLDLSRWEAVRTPLSARPGCRCHRAERGDGP
ncbi:MAG: ThiF family adenylyltransferase [Synergistaceae bacterium]|nr:ThiF family adenylyltransferase [Synergistaceae bacterium]